MPRNGSGGYSPPTNTWNPAVNGVSATASDYQTLLNDIAAAIQQSLSADGQTPVTGSINMGGNRLTALAAGTATGHSLRFEQLFSQGLQADVAAAATTGIGAALSTLVNVTGSATITSFGTNYNGPRFLRFAGVCTLTNSATLVLPGGANITTAAGDSAIAVPLGNPATGWRVAAYQKADGTPLVGAGGAIVSSPFTMATNRILGRVTAGTGAIEELTPAQGRDILGIPTSVATDSITDAAGTGAPNFPNGMTAPSITVGSLPTFQCRAWVNFNGTGTPAIRASGNVSSITDNGTGDYTVNFTTALPDANYSFAGAAGFYGAENNAAQVVRLRGGSSAFIAPGSVRIVVAQTASGGGVALLDCDLVNVAIFR